MNDSNADTSSVFFPEQLKAVPIAEIEKAIANAVGALVGVRLESQISDVELKPLSGASIKLRLTRPASEM